MSTLEVNLLFLAFIPAIWLAWAAVGFLIMWVPRIVHKILYRW